MSSRTFRSRLLIRMIYFDLVRLITFRGKLEEDLSTGAYFRYILRKCCGVYFQIRPTLSLDTSYEHRRLITRRSEVSIRGTRFRVSLSRNVRSEIARVPSRNSPRRAAAAASRRTSGVIGLSPASGISSAFSPIQSGL